MYMQETQAFIGVDVGSGSARAVCLDSRGQLMGRVCSHPFKLHSVVVDTDTFLQQSSDEIWNAVCRSVTEAVTSARESTPQTVTFSAIAFDATCSLVAVDGDGSPVSVSPCGTDTSERSGIHNIVFWADHRAVKDASVLSKAVESSIAINRLGGTIPAEHQLPKCMWLAANTPHVVEAVRHGGLVLDLVDYLTLRATGHLSQRGAGGKTSFAASVCKWGYTTESTSSSGTLSEHAEVTFEDSVADALGDDAALLVRSGRCGTIAHPESIPVDCYGNPGFVFTDVGENVGVVCAELAEHVGVGRDCVVGAGVVDAYAGFIGSLCGSSHGGSGLCASIGRMGVIAGTSMCHIVNVPKPIIVKGVWGPYCGVGGGSKWFLEGGLSACGSAVSYVISNHPASGEVATLAAAQKLSVFAFLNDTLKHMWAVKSDHSDVPTLSWLWRRLYVLPDFHGNRSPHADPHARGGVLGLSLESGIEDLALRYGAVVESLAHATKAIVDAINVKSGDDGDDRARGAGTEAEPRASTLRTVSSLHFSGSCGRNMLLLQLHADVTGLPVFVPEGFAETEAAVEGSSVVPPLSVGEVDDVSAGVAVLAAAAARRESVLEIARRFSRPVRCVTPDETPAVRRYFNARHIAQQHLFDALRECDNVMASAGGCRDLMR